jgi:hypothetical protein
LVYKADRLGRDDRERRRVEDLFNEVHAWLVADAFGGRYDLTTADGIKGFRDAINAAEFYSRQLSERLRDHHQVLADAGRDSGGPRPYGFESDRVTVRESEAERVREAARRVVSGHSLRGICADWNARGLKTAQGVPWRPTRLRRILTNPRYVGLREHQGETTPAVWEAILDRPTFDAVGAILEDPERKTADSTARRRLLTGFLYCKNCGARMYSHGTPSGRRYRCQQCNLVSVAADLLDEYVATRANDRRELRQIEGGPERQPEPKPRDEAAERLAQIEEQLRELGREYAAGRLEMEAFAEASRVLRKERTELRSTVARRMPITGLTMFRDMFEKEGPFAPWEPEFNNADLEDWRLMIQSEVSRVEVGPAKKKGPGFDPARVTLVWLKPPP